MLDEGNTDSGEKDIERKSIIPLLSHACVQ